MNGYMEMEIFHVSGKKKVGRARKMKDTMPAQRKINDKNSKKFFSRLVNTNFTSGDLTIDLTYSNRHLPSSREEVRRDVRNYIEKLKRVRKKEGLPQIKYIYVISNSDQYGNEARWHVHMFVNTMDRDIAENKWTKGTANAGKLHPNEYGITGKAMYVAKQKKGERSWSASTNLKRPEALVSDHKVSRRQLEHIADSPDDRRFIERMINGKNHIWTFTDCIVEYDGRQMIIDGLSQVEGLHNGISVMIRARNEVKQE